MRSSSVSPNCVGEEHVRTSNEMAKNGFLKAGACVGVSGERCLEFWPIDIACIVPCIFMVLNQVYFFSKKKAIYTAYVALRRPKK